jgi:2'-5' RNA ligase
MQKLLQADHTSRRRQASLFIPDPVGAAIDALRRQWDPQMAARIPAHMTLWYAIEAAPLTTLLPELAAIGRAVAPFRLHIGQAAVWETPQQGIYLKVADRDGGFATLRHLNPLRTADHRMMTPHITLLHPRTNGAQGPTAWQTLQHAQFFVDIWIDTIFLIEEGEQQWETIAIFALEGVSAER